MNEQVRGLPAARRRVARWGVVLVLAVAGAGCGVEGLGGEPPDDVLWDSAHFRYHTRTAEMAACPEVLDLLEQNFTALESYLAFTWPLRHKVDYHKYLDKSDYKAHAPCPADSGGCAIGTSVETPLPFDRHELAHAFLETSGNPPALLKEGLATILACSPHLNRAELVPWRDAVAARDPLKELGIYVTGGLLVGYLLREYGPEAFMRLYRSLGNGARPDDIDAAVQEIYGTSTDTLWQLAQDADVDCLQVWPCSRSELPLDGSPVTVAPQCGAVADARTLTLPRDGNLAVTTPGPLRLSACPGGERVSVYPKLAGEASLLTLMPLAAGRYFVEYQVASGLQMSAGLLQTPSVGLDCAALAPYPIAAGDYPEIAVLAPSPADAWVVRLRFDGPHLLHLDQYPSDATAITRLTICPDCDLGSALCQNVDMGFDGLDVLWEGDYVVRVVSPDPHSHVALELRIQGR